LKTMFNHTCFQIYYNDIYLYVKRAYLLASDNYYLLTFTTFIYTGGIKILKEAWEVDYFGVDNLLILIVLLTTLIDARFGVKRSVKRSREAYLEAQQYKKNSPIYKKLMKEHELRKFSPTRL